MSNYTRHRPMPDAAALSRNMLSKAERELAEGYLEVEITGLTIRRLVAVYTVLLRNAFAHSVHSLRSLLRPTPVH